MTQSSPTAALIIIGNEILSGRTTDKNLNYIATHLAEAGIVFAEVIVIPDVEQRIIDVAQDFSKRFDYVFTTGGIGPTHDDITAESIAKAFGDTVAVSKEAVTAMEAYYATRGETVNEARLKMAMLPTTAIPISNVVTGAPGFRINNVYVLAGVPKIMQAMFDLILPTLKGGEEIFSTEIVLKAAETKIAAQLETAQLAHSDIDIGCYPSYENGVYMASVVLRGKKIDAIKALEAELKATFAEFIDA